LVLRLLVLDWLRLSLLLLLLLLLRCCLALRLSL
jgi:hypothetical protein